jgi:hypothetical protein
MTDMQERIRRLEGRAELLGLVVRYFVASDDDDLQALGARFAIDGRFGAAGFPPGVTSRVEVVRFVRAERRQDSVRCRPLRRRVRAARRGLADPRAGDAHAPHRTVGECRHLLDVWSPASVARRRPHAG